ncbi:MAG: hypothetical protein LKJ69_01500 [Lactobacillus sp.]|nr:hypothetical protein [Lactobacillus sp.]MCI2032058.1 hypothetical protein [Lactobacillus sp.]
MTPYQYLDELDGMIEDFDYNEQQAMTNFGIMPDVYEAAGYKRMNELMQARPRDKRPVDAFEWMDSLGRKSGGK